MELGGVTFEFFLIFSGAAVFASVALYTRQPLIISYIALGAVLGPYGISLVADPKQLSQIGHIGIIFLLFLLGLDMQPRALWSTLRHTGELMIGLLLLQDLLAIVVLMVLYSATTESSTSMGMELARSLLSLPVLVLFALVAVRYAVLPLITRFDRFHEYIFLLAIGWCLGLAEAAGALGLSEEIGAFIAGISLATSPISQYIAVSLKPLRDFFLILFFP